MTKEQLELVDKLKAKVGEVNELIAEVNKDKDNSIRIYFYQEDWHASINHNAIKNAVKYLSCKISETFTY